MKFVSLVVDRAEDEARGDARRVKRLGLPWPDLRSPASQRVLNLIEMTLADEGDGSELSKEPRELDEAALIGSAATQRDIPTRYKTLPVLGRGTTTIALDLMRPTSS